MNKNPKLETLCVRLIKHCNLSCSHCRAGSSPYTKKKNKINSLRNVITDFVSLGLKHVSISGGEPFIDKRLPNFVNWLLNNGLHVTITTNGTIPIENFFKSDLLKPSSRLRLRVSIDGDKSIHNSIRGKGTYKKAIETLEVIKKWNEWAGINTVVFPGENPVNEKLVSKISNLSIDEWSLITLVAQGHAKNKSIDGPNLYNSINRTKKFIIENGFNGNITIWNFWHTPLTSLLIDAEGVIKLTSNKSGNDILLGKTDSYSLNLIKSAIKMLQLNKFKSHFTWNRWFIQN